jgi:dephospho-CoA kinase
MPFTVALTGGIAAGKSAAEQHFRAHGVHVYDADQASRVVVEPGSEGLAAIVAAFGQEVLDAHGRLDRPRMRERVFADPTARTTLEAIVHPRVRAWMLEQVQADQGPYVMLAIPLLAENLGHYRWVDRIVVVDLPEALQLQRLMARDGMDEDLALRILATQASRSARLQLADDVIDNSGPPAAMAPQVDALHRRYLALAVQRR